MPEPSFVQRFLRERALSRYLAALERGDINAVIAVLDQSSKDGALEQMIFDLHETYQTEEEFLEMVQEVQDEPDVIEVENGVFKSRLEGKLPALRHLKKRKYRVYERIVQTLVAAILVVCVLSSLFITAGFPPNSLKNPGSASTNHCISAGAPISAYAGVPTFSQVAALAPDNVWLAGSFYSNTSFLKRLPLLEHWDGVRWSVVPGGNVQPLFQSGSTWDEAYLTRLAVLSANNIWAVGGVGTYSLDAYSNYLSGRGQPLIEHWNGWQWQLMSVAAGITESYSVLNDVVAVSANDIWAVGYASDASRMRSTALLEHWDGRQWTRVQQKPLALQVGVLDKIIATSANDIWAFGRASGLFQNFSLVEHWDGHAWSVTSLDAAGLSAVSAVVALSSDDIWVAGSVPLLGSGLAPALIIHWNGQRWTKIAGSKELGAGITLQGLEASGTNSIWAVGSTADGHALIEHWNGQQWNIVQHESPAYSYLTDITLVNSKIWAVGGTYKSGLDSTPTGSLIETSC